jgi:hypothetical protein
MTNMRGVYKEVFTYKNGFKSRLDFFDLKNQPMESNWKIASYQWKASKDWIIEKRYNLNGEEVPLSPSNSHFISQDEYREKRYFVGCKKKGSNQFLFLIKYMKKF